MQQCHGSVTLWVLKNRKLLSEIKRHPQKTKKQQQQKQKHISSLDGRIKCHVSVLNPPKSWKERLMRELGINGSLSAWTAAQTDERQEGRGGRGGKGGGSGGGVRGEVLPNSTCNDVLPRVLWVLAPVKNRHRIQDFTVGLWFWFTRGHLIGPWWNRNVTFFFFFKKRNPHPWIASFVLSLYCHYILTDSFHFAIPKI